MKYLISTFTFILFIQLNFAQSESLKIKLTRSSKILNLIKLGDEGFILKTGKNIPNSKKLNWTLSSYKKDLSLNWSVKIKKDQINKGLNNHIILSPNYQTVYHIEEKAYNSTIGKSSYFVTKINNKGDTSLLNLRGFKDWKGDLQNIFCNNQSLFFLTAEETVKRVDDSQNFILIKINIETSDISSIHLKLPITNKESSLWTYSNNTEDKIVFCRKFRDKCEVLNLDNNGKQIGSFDLLYDFKVKTVPSVNVKSNQYSYYDYSLESYFKQSKSGYASTRKRGSYGELIIDFENDNYYTYGLLGSSDVSDYETTGFFINKYDFKGKLVWSKTNNFPSNLIKNNLFIKLYTQNAIDYRQLSLVDNSPEPNSISLRIKCKNELNIINFSKETGEKTNAYYIKSSAITADNFYQINLGSKKANSNIENLNKKLKYLNYIQYSEGENAVFFDSKKYEVNLLYFRD